MTGLRRALRELPEGVFVDVLESDEAYRFVVDVPGATAEDVTVEVDAVRLSIEADRGGSAADAAGPSADADGAPADADHLPADATVVESRRDDRIAISLPLPPDAATDADATATVERGVLEVTVPKRGVAAATEVEVSGG